MSSYLLNKYLKWSVKRFSRGAVKAMLLSSEMIKNKHVDVKYFSDYAKLSLVSRPGWTKLSESYFENKNGLGITINNEDSIKQVIKKMIEVEILNVTIGNNNSEELIKIALEEVDHFFSK